MVGIDIYQVAKDIISSYKRKNIKKIPIKRFEALIRSKYRLKFKLNISQRDIQNKIEELQYSREIEIRTDSTGHKYVLTNDEY